MEHGPGETEERGHRTQDLVVKGNASRHGTGHTWRGHVNETQNKWNPLRIRGSVLCMERSHPPKGLTKGP